MDNNLISNQLENISPNDSNNNANIENINKTPSETENVNNNNNVSLKDKTFVYLNVGQWGYISGFFNFFSVIVQMYKTLQTKKTKAFSMGFISLMTFLNFIYFIIGLLTENHGMTFACLIFVIYNMTIVYFYYFGNKK
tara:strand:- start:153 stop:566 length:414 start_codon:yes stop_codon:yes gene_type:complete